VAPAGIQMGRYAGETIAAELAHATSPKARRPFVYRDKGTMAVIGKAKAVAVIGRLQVSGFLAWVLWGGVHIAFLIGFRNRLLVLLSWFWNWLFNTRDVRLITGDARLDIKTPRSAEFVRDELPANEMGVAQFVPNPGSHDDHPRTSN
jgi:NADH dehydrogenase